MKIQFIKTQEVEAQGEIVKTFNAGEIYELSIASAKRWIRRNVATEVQGAVKPVLKKSEPEKPVVKRKYVRQPPITSTKATPKPDNSDTGGRPVPVTSDGGSSTTPGNNSNK